jgi:hypothetical protein
MSVRNDFLFNSLACILTSSFIKFNDLVGKGRGEKDKKKADHRILERQTVSDLKTKLQEQISIHIH